MREQGTLPGDTVSFGEDINDQGEIVGISMPVEFSGLRAVLWENGVPFDLNSIVFQGRDAGCTSWAPTLSIAAGRSQARGRQAAARCTHFSPSR